MESSNRMPSHHQGPVTSGSPRTRKQSWRNVFGISTAPVLLLAVILGLMALTLATPEPAFAQSQGTGDPLTLYDANDNGVIDADELITAASDYFAGRIERDLLVRVARLYLSSAQSRTTRSTEAPMHICSLSDTNENGMIERNEVIAAINKYLFGDSMAEGALTRDDVIDVINCYLFPPEVAQASYSFSIAEDASAGTIVGTVGATGTVGRVTYSIAEGNESGQFATTTRGAITIAIPLDHETRPTHTLTVRVGDGTGMWDEATVTVTVTDVFESTVSLDIPSPVAGQTVTMTATSDAPAGETVSYQWQQLVNSRWTDDNSTSTSKQVTSTSPNSEIYRVVATYGISNRAEPHPALVNWRSLSVAIDASPEHPDAGDTVTLTASTDAPAGVSLTYTWQEKTGGVWTNLSVTSPATTVPSSNQRVREYRLLVAYGASDSAESPPRFMVWDEPELFADLSADVAQAVASSTAYTTAETTFLACVNTGWTGGDRFSSFDDVLASYDSNIEAVVEGCEGRGSNPTTMFQTIERQSVTELNNLTAASTTYATLVRTPRGQDFAANVGSSHQIKLIASVRASGSNSVTTSSAATSTATRSEVGPDPVVERVGLDCLPYSGTRPLTHELQVGVVNCLVFDTPHSFWTNNANQLKDRIDNRYLRADGALVGPVDWLGYGDWRCTMALQGPVVSCKKHDVAYDSLQKFVIDEGQDERDDGDPDILDETWHPRNKALADSKFYVDILAHGCQEQSGFIATRMCRNLPNSAIAEIYYLAVSRINDKGWPVTAQDLDHARAKLDRIPPASDSQISNRSSNHAFVACDKPVPTLSDVALRDLGAGSFEWTWTHADGCVPGIEIESVSMCATIQAGELVYFLRCEEASGDATSLRFAIANFPPGTVATAARVTAKLKPRNREYGGGSYTDDWAVTPSR